ncbi:hypothetical protein NXU83_26610 [Bacteroides thetaiotaomicron]|nr:hypothetical protein [Bacteroides thetaiotaomicron]MCS3185073.1 hypothetical protein [Bacteroides thetaiotaomicron]
MINFISGMDKSIHHVLIQKRTEGEWGKTTIHQFVLHNKGELMKETECPSRHIEFIGNSLTCGYGVEGKTVANLIKLKRELQLILCHYYRPLFQCRLYAYCTFRTWSSPQLWRFPSEYLP